MGNELKKPTIFINMLGEFTIAIEDNKINDFNTQSKKPWNLLEYLITYRNKEITPNELVELIWGDEESSNPSGALKTLMFRSRKLLIPLGYPPQELIIQRRGSYSWNTDFITIVDIDVFENLSGKILSDTAPPESQLSLCREAISLYRGDFLPKSCWESWVIPISTYYHSLYQKIIHRTISLLMTANNYHEIIDVCQNALTIEPFDEEIHYHLIYALFKNGNQHGALEHYNHTINMFYNEFAITPSNRLKDLYKTIQDTNHGILTDLSLIQESLYEETNHHGAFLCEYTVFKDIHQLESRAIGRTGDSIYLCLFTISDSNGILPKLAILSRAMDELGKSICNSLRRGDVYTRYSVSQYMILLPSSTYENGEMVLHRITQNFKKHYARKDLLIIFSLQAVLPH